jgi:hypothetical protein
MEFYYIEKSNPISYTSRTGDQNQFVYDGQTSVDACVLYYYIDSFQPTPHPFLTHSSIVPHDCPNDGKVHDEHMTEN